MALLANRRSDLSIGGHYQEFTITEILSDSIVRSMMKADGVDPQTLEAQLRSMALTMPKGAAKKGQCRRATARSFNDSCCGEPARP